MVYPWNEILFDNKKEKQYEPWEHYAKNIKKPVTKDQILHDPYMKCPQ